MTAADFILAKEEVEGKCQELLDECSSKQSVPAQLQLLPGKLDQSKLMQLEEDPSQILGAIKDHKATLQEHMASLESRKAKDWEKVSSEIDDELNRFRHTLNMARDCLEAVKVSNQKVRLGVKAVDNRVRRPHEACRA